jgi:uncharacterized protein YbjT (DUF2867 family)
LERYRDISNGNPVLVLGATGYVGNRLVPYLLERGHRVRAAARSIEKLRERPFGGHPNVELAAADVFDRETLKNACEGCSVVYYLVHSMNPDESDFSVADRRAAENMVWAAEETGISRIIYLGGLGDESPDLSKHLRSRAEVGNILQSGKVPVTYLRAAMIIGSGSASFEILRYLVDRLPLMIMPRWVDTKSQPIAISNVLRYLAGCLEVPDTIGRTFDIGGPDILTYHELMEIYAEEARLPKRFIITVPVLTPRLSSYWIHLVTPIPAALARPLAEGLKNKTVCREDAIRELIPQELLNCRNAIKRSLAYSHYDLTDKPDERTSPGHPPEGTYPGDPSWAGGTRFRDNQRIIIEGTPEDVWVPIQRIGGKSGWYFANHLWRLRGFIDRLIGGAGFSRGRSNDVTLATGDTIDCWRVMSVVPKRELRLAAEMILPGCAALEFRIIRLGEGRTELEQKSWFVPRGQAGILYWYLLYPFHRLIFKGMLQGIARYSKKRVVIGPEFIGD